MGYNGTPLTPANAQAPSTSQTPASQDQINNMYAIAAALLKNNPNQKMQSWLQPLAQMANSYAASKYLNAAQAADKALTGRLSQPPSGAPSSGAPSASSAATPVSQPGMVPGGQVNPLLALFQSGGITGDPNATPAGASGMNNPISALFGLYGGGQGSGS